MSESPLVNAIVDRLRQAGYVDVRTPFRVATVSFEFTAAMRGRDGRALDLILLVDTTTGDFGDRDPARVRQRVEALSRALDVTRSRYVVTVILVGAALAGDVEALSETSRVLYVEALSLDGDGLPADVAAANALEDRIRVLLPLELPPPVAEGGSAVKSPIGALLAALSNEVNQPLLDVVVAASNEGEEAVTIALSKLLNSALGTEQEEE